MFDNSLLISRSITAPAGYQAEYHIYLVGLDIEEKAKFTEDQIKEALGPEILAKFSMLKFHLNGTSPIDAPNQDLATVDFRIFAQSSDRELLRMTNPDGFFRRSMVTFLEGVPVSAAMLYQYQTSTNKNRALHSATI